MDIQSIPRLYTLTSKQWSLPEANNLGLFFTLQSEIDVTAHELAVHVELANTSSSSQVSCIVL